MTVLSIAVKPSSPKLLKNAFAAGTSLKLDELEAELTLPQHILGVQNLKPVLLSDCPNERQFLDHSSTSRLSNCARDTSPSREEARGSALLILS